MIFKAILVTAIPVAIIAGLYWAQRPREIEPSWRNANNVGDGAAPWSGNVQAKYPNSLREHEPRGM